MIRIDGSVGEGGGQVLRTSLALSMVTGEPVRIVQVRAKRKQPGLKQQHLTALRAAAEVCGAGVAGDELRSREVEFRPGAIRAGRYRFDVGTAGSATLVLQTVLPALLKADEPSQVEVSGGTHNPWSPPFDYLDRVFSPLLERMGHRLGLTLDRHGFFPAGGGRIRADIRPGKKTMPLELTRRGELERTEARALVSRLPVTIAEREVNLIAQRLGWKTTTAYEVEAACPGNACFAALEFEEVTELFTGFGKRGKPAERVAADVVREVRNYLRSDAAVGEHLADQLLLPMALFDGGSFVATHSSSHARTNLRVIEEFMGPRFTTKQAAKDRWLFTSL
jgi:RNA 3'-terminal phosphate cyclase (ATP)